MSAEQEVVVGLLAAASSLVAGLLGAGGDVLLVPLLLYALPALAGDPLDVHAVAALSLVGSIASTGSGGLRHLLEGSLDRVALWPAAGLLAGGALAGGLLSPLVADRSLLAVFAVVTTAAALLLLVPPGRGLAPVGAPRVRRDPLAAALLAGSGLVCGAVGVGGGFLIIAVLLYRQGVPMHLAKGTGLLLTVATAGPALLGKALTGQVVWDAVPAIVVAALAGALIGVRLGAGIPDRALRLALAALVGVLAVRVWIDVLGGTRW